MNFLEPLPADDAPTPAPIYAFDSEGWYRDYHIMGREVSVAPPEAPWGEGMHPRWVAGAWTLDTYVEPPIPEPEPVFVSRPITRLAFLNRFTIAEYAAILTRQKTDVIVEIFIMKTNAATFIDLARADVQQGVGYLAQEGLVTPERAAAIVNDPIQDIEKPVAL